MHQTNVQTTIDTFEKEPRLVLAIKLRQLTPKRPSQSSVFQTPSRKKLPSLVASLRPGNQGKTNAPVQNRTRKTPGSFKQLRQKIFGRVHKRPLNSLTKGLRTTGRVPKDEETSAKRFKTTSGGPPKGKSKLFFTLSSAGKMVSKIRG